MIPLTRRLQIKLAALAVVGVWTAAGPPLSGRHLLFAAVAVSVFWEIRVTRVRERSAASQQDDC